MSHLDAIPAVFSKRIFQKVFKIAEVSNLTKEEKAMYDSNLKAKWDYENSLAYAKEVAAEEGLKKGMEKGMEQGIQKGEYSKALAIALEMKKDKLPSAQISKFTKLSIEEIEKL
jgi:predicted transposase/invertase (TIGR01784 family)